MLSRIIGTEWKEREGMSRENDRRSERERTRIGKRPERKSKAAESEIKIGKAAEERPEKTWQESGEILVGMR